MSTDMEEEDDLTKQVDEVEAMSAIYADDWCVVDEVSRIYCIAVCGQDERSKICLQVLLPDGYPSKQSPIFQLNAPWLTGHLRTNLETGLTEVCTENIGESVLFLLVERIKEFLEENIPESDAKEMPTTDKSEHQSLHNACQEAKSVKLSLPNELSVSHVVNHQTPLHIELPPIHHGDTITDRRSTFQPHLAFPVVEVQQVKLVLQKLTQNKKIANATHNIMAYRIYAEDRDSFLQDCDDDGETAAGGRLLHLLQIVDARNVMVVVSRWYGGILLGPDRFKHINNAARSILDSSGIIKSKESAQKTKKTKQKGR